MAIFHASVTTISRKAGQSAVAAAAYRAGVLLYDERAGKFQDYTRKGGVLASFIVAPVGTPCGLLDRAALWVMAERAEVKSNARVAREARVALPHELSPTARETLVRDYADILVKRYGVVVDASIHLPDREGDQRNHHAHMLFTTREATSSGLGAKTRILDDIKTGPKEIMFLRQAWEGLVNAALAKAGLSVRVDHRSHQDIGVDVPPQIHVGVNATNMARRGLEPAPSVIQHDFKGREVNYPEIDDGQSRAQHNAEIIELQKYREPETLAEEVARVRAKVVDLAASIEELEATLNSDLIGDDLRSLLRVMIEKAVARVIYQNHQQTRWLEERAKAKQTARELKAATAQYEALIKYQAEIEQRLKEEEGRVQAARKIVAQITLMPATLNGIPPYTIKLQIPLSSQFNEASYLGVLRKQETAQLLKAVLSPPILPSKPILATVALRQDILQVKELLGRTNPRPLATQGSRFLTVGNVRVRK